MEPRITVKHWTNRQVSNSSLNYPPKVRRRARLISPPERHNERETIDTGTCRAQTTEGAPQTHQPLTQPGTSGLHWCRSLAPTPATRDLADTPRQLPSHDGTDHASQEDANAEPHYPRLHTRQERDIPQVYGSTPPDSDSDNTQAWDMSDSEEGQDQHSDESTTQEEGDQQDEICNATGRTAETNEPPTSSSGLIREFWTTTFLHLEICVFYASSTDASPTTTPVFMLCPEIFRELLKKNDEKLSIAECLKLWKKFLNFVKMPWIYTRQVYRKNN